MISVEIDAWQLPSEITGPVFHTGWSVSIDCTKHEWGDVNISVPHVFIEKCTVV